MNDLEEKEIKPTINQKFKRFLCILAPILLVVGLATGTLFAVTGGVNEYSPKTISAITKNRYKRVDKVRSNNNTKLELKKLSNHKYKRTTKGSSAVKNVYYMMEDGHLLFTYTEYKNGEISISIEGEEKYYNVIEN